MARSARPLHVLTAKGKWPEPELWEQLAAHRVICFGEQHRSPEHHYAQTRALEELATRAAAIQRSLAVGFEMFQRPFQKALTQFVAGALPEKQFLRDSEYVKRWGHDFSLYRPLLKLAREFSLEALALNAPKEITRKIGRLGLAALDPAERNSLPRLNLRDAEHRAYFEALMEAHPLPDDGPKFEDVYAAQVVWDETMAQTAARWLEHAGPTAQLIVFASSGHCHESAIPARITRRVGVPVLSVTPIFRSELASFTARRHYDWLVVIER